MGSVSITRLEGSALEAALGELADLRIRIFRAWPYIYDGDLDYERAYLAKLAESERATLVVAQTAAGAFVGAATAAPLIDHFDEFAEAFAGQDIDIENTYYLAESLLDPAWRGRGIGVRFFFERESAARQFGYSRAVFCGVIRQSDHPLHEPGYVPLDAFWRNRGYQKLNGVTANFAWKDLGDQEETEKQMQFWSKDL